MLKQLWSAPNQLTLLRLCMVPLLVIAVLNGRFRTACALFILAGISDGLDGVLARRLHQRTVLGQYLDPIADKLLLSTMFLVLTHVGLIPRSVTVLVFSRDFGVVILGSLMFAVAGLRDFGPSIFGKANTLAQILAVMGVLVSQFYTPMIVVLARQTALYSTMVLTVLSALHYVMLSQRRIDEAALKANH